MKKTTPYTRKKAAHARAGIERRAAVNATELAICKATRMTTAELAQPRAPLMRALRPMLAGQGSHDDWETLTSALAAAYTIDQGRIVTGINAHLDAAQDALMAIYQRATRSQPGQLHSAALSAQRWQPTALHYQERDALDLLATLHSYQIKNLSYGEYQAAILKTVRIVAAKVAVIEKATPPTPTTQGA